MNVGSLFSGAGLMDWGLTLAGFDHAWFCEADPFCRSVLERRWPGVPIYEDVRSLASPGRVDLLAGGFPCQDLSVVGRRAGIGGERSGLWSEFARLVGELRPGYVLVENVPGLLIRGMRSGTAYRLPPSAPHIYERGSSFWPTPIVDSASGRTTPYSQGGVPLQVAVRWRTPTVGMVNQARSRDPEYAAKLAAKGQTVTLAAQAQAWPTPTASRWSGLQSHGRNAILGQLNPTWVEWLMGCPLGWTDCELSETASSLRSRATSASESLTVNGEQRDS